MGEFRKYYKFPLKYDGHSYIWTNNGKMAFNSLVSDEDTQKIVNILNGILDKKCNAQCNDGYIVIDGRKCLLVRGWGMLTGIGGYHLERNKAAEIQDEFVHWCVNRLNGGGL